MYQNWIEKFTKMRTNFFAQSHDEVLDHLVEFSKLNDKYLVELWNLVRVENDDTHLVALGGFGRQELFPYSDIDLVFHTSFPEKNEKSIAQFLMVLRDARIKVGHAVRTPKQIEKTIEDEFEVAVSYLESRNVFPDAGGPVAAKDFAIDFLRGQDQGVAFVKQLIVRFEARRDRSGRSIYLLEPDVKRGPGGLRDLQSLRWASLVRFGKDPLRDPDEEHFKNLHAAYTQAAELRWVLHLEGKRDRLRFDLQESVAEKLGYTSPKELMRRHYLSARTIRKYTERLFRAWSADTTQSLQQPYLEDDSERVKSQNQEDALIPVSQHLDDMRVFDLLEKAVKDNALLSPNLENQIEAFTKDWDESDPLKNARFSALIFDPLTSWRTSRRLLEMGLLMQLIPELKPLDCHVHHDVYHVYTTDAHSIRCLEFARALLAGNAQKVHSWIETVAGKITQKRLLLIACLTHDIGKNRPFFPSDERLGHSAKGALLSDTFGPRLGFSAVETELIRFLILEHLTLSHAARRLDINDPRVLRDIVSCVRNTENLDLLIVLTYCDISTVNPNAMTDWTSSLLEQLYLNVHQVLTHGYQKRWEMLSETIHEKTVSLIEKLGDRNDVNRFVRSLPMAHIRYAEIESLALQFKTFKKLQKDKEPQFLVHVDADSQTTELVVICKNMPGILTKIAGGLTASGVNIFSANIVSTTRNIVIDSFRIGSKLTSTQFGPVPDARLQKAIENLKAAFDGSLDVDALIEQRKSSSKTEGSRSPKVAIQTTWSNELSDEFSVFEIRAPDQSGLLYAITKCFFDAQIDIVSSKIDSEGAQVIDTFFVQSITGGKLTEELGEDILTRLLTRIEFLSAVKNSE